jgi:photosystem II stability/assembly factor-like uncharacterized protein
MLKNKYIVFWGLLLVSLLATSVIWQSQVEAQSKVKRGKTVPERKVAAKAKETFQDLFDEEELEKLDLQRKRGQYYYNQRAYPLGSIPVTKYTEAIKNLEKFEKENKIAPSVATDPLRAIGPTPVNGGQTAGNTRGNVSGRITSLAVDPRNSNTVYLGAAQGGVWRSTDSGQSWTPLTNDAPTQATGAIAIDPTNSNVIYVGTGEGNLSGDTFFGMGILKSTDGGNSWKQFAANTFLGCGINKIVVDPRNPNNVYASSTFSFGGLSSDPNPQIALSGIYKSTDGGQTFNRSLIVTGQISIGAFGYDIEMDPTNSQILYATLEAEGVYKTVNGGTTWSKLSGGLPTNGFGRSDIGLSRSNPSVIYATFESLNTGDILDFYKSTNGGDSWTVINKPRGDFTCQCSYDQTIEVDPSNPDNVYFGGVWISRSTDGGQNWVDISNNTHADYHAIAFAPSNPRKMFVGNDGGVWVSNDAGNSFSNANTNLSITQFQSISIHPTNPNITIGGTQDNGTEMFVGTDAWKHADDGDGGFARIDPINPGTMYHTFFNARGLIGPARSDAGGALGSWRLVRNGINQSDDVLFYAPFELDPVNQDTLYFGTFRLYRSTDKGENWMSLSGKLSRQNRQVISAIGIAKGAPVVYTGATDGSVFVTKDNGANFQDVTDNLPQRYVSDVIVDSKDPNTVYVTLSGFRSGHVYKSTTGGGNWQDLTANLPDIPANAFAINPNDSNNLFVGTDLGLFETMDGGKSWTRIPGMPMVAVFDIDVNQKLGILRAATHGRGVYETKLTVPATAAPDFTLAINPATQTVMPGQNATFTISSQPLNGFNQMITLTATSSQTTVQTSLSATTIAANGTSTLTVATSANTPGGAVTLSITGTSGQIVKNQTATLTVNRPNAPPTISQIANQSVKAGTTSTVNISAMDPDGNAGLVLSLVSAPNFVTLKDNGNGSGVITLMPAMTGAQGGLVTVQVKDSGGLIAQTSFNVTVAPAISINSASFAKPNLSISGSGFGTSGVKVIINNKDVSSVIVSQSDTAITLKGNKKKLNLVKGTNQLTVTNSNGASANATFNF